MDAKDYFDLWGLRSPVELAQTTTSTVFKVVIGDRPAVLKVLTPTGQKDESGGFEALKYFNGLGAVRLQKHDDQAQLLDFIDGSFLKTLSSSGADQKATHIACTVIKKLHTQRSLNPPRLRTLSDLFLGFFRHTELMKDNLLLRDGAVVASDLLKDEMQKVVLHGDLHHKNIIESSTEGWLSIDPKGYFGERTFDLANLFYNPDDQPTLVETELRIKEMADIFSEELKIDRKRILKFAFAFGCLSAYWSAEDGLDPSRRLRIANLIRNIL